MIYSNNYGLAGKTSIFYKAVTKGYVSEDETVDEFGIEYDSNKIVLLQNQCLPSDSVFTQTDTYAYKIRETANRPYIIMVKGFTANSSHTFKTYVIKNGETTEYNQITIKTISGTNKVQCLGYKQESSCSSSNYTTCKPILQSNMEEAIELMNAFTNISWSFSASVYTATDGTAADSSMRFNSRSIANKNDTLRSVIIHEMAHNKLSGSWKGTSTMKFMEFATDCEKAIAKWLSGHNYPLISSARYDYIDDGLIALAMQLSQSS